MPRKTICNCSISESVGLGLGFVLVAGFLAFEGVVLSQFAQFDEGELGSVLALEGTDAGLEGPDFASHFPVSAPLRFGPGEGRDWRGKISVSPPFPLISAHFYEFRRIGRDLR